MILTIPDEKVKEVIKKCTPVSSIDELAEGDKVVMSVGTWCCRWLNNDWRWIKGHVKSVRSSQTTNPRTGEEIQYNIYEISPVKNRFLRMLFPEILTVDINQPYHNPNPSWFTVTYGRIFKYAN